MEYGCFWAREEDIEKYGIDKSAILNGVKECGYVKNIGEVIAPEGTKIEKMEHISSPDDNMPDSLKSAEPLPNPTISNTLKERGQTHCDYTTFAEIWRELENIVFSEWDGSNVESSSMSMVLHKIARVLNAPKPHIDNWVDIGGYAKLVVDNTEDELFDYIPNTSILKELIETIKVRGSHLGDLEYRGLMHLIPHLSMMLATSSWNDINRISENIVKELQDESNSSPEK